MKERERGKGEGGTYVRVMESECKGVEGATVRLVNAVDD